MKSFTDIEQSKKLAKILPKESADCYWDYDEMQKFHRISWFEDGFNKESQLLNENNVCAWSLAALLEIINKDFYTDLYHDGELWTVDVQHHDNGEINDFVYSDEPIDACVEMIVKLKEKGLI